MPGGAPCDEKVRAAAQSTLYCLSVRLSRGHEPAAPPLISVITSASRRAPVRRRGRRTRRLYEHKDVLRYSSGFKTVRK